MLEGVTVSWVGVADRQGQTTAEGRLRMLNVPAGTTGVRFEREGFYTFEKEVIWRTGLAAPAMIVTLNAAPPPPPPPPPPPAEPAKGDLKSAAAIGAQVDGAARLHRAQFISSKEAHKENLVGCSGVGQSVLWQVREPWNDRQHPSADAMMYIIGGEGSLRMDNRDVNLAAGSFAVVPRGTSYGFTRRGRNPLIVLAFLAGAPCAGN